MDISQRPTPERPTTPTRRTNPSSSSSSPGYDHYIDLDKTPTNSPGYKTYKAKDYLTGKSEKEILEIQKKLFQLYRSDNPKSDTLVETTNVANPDESITNSPGYRTSKVRGYLTAQLEKQILEIQNKPIEGGSYHPSIDTLAESTNVTKSNGNEKEMGRNINSTKTDKKRGRKECKAIKKNPNNNDDANSKKTKS
tara:strand:+ start:541 stop:1125 length:585 start_codon:yes stop_codon:yes gene_type:complete